MEMEKLENFPKMAKSFSTIDKGNITSLISQDTGIAENVPFSPRKGGQQIAGNIRSFKNTEDSGNLKSFKTEAFSKEDANTISAAPLRGMVNAGADINITYSQLEENIESLRNAINTLKSSWNDETKSNISIINGSWAGTDCSEYTKKLSNMDTKVQNTISALELLCSTYEKARNMVKDNQTKTVTSIVNLG